MCVYIGSLLPQRFRSIAADLLGLVETGMHGFDNGWNVKTSATEEGTSNSYTHTRTQV